MQSTQIKGVLEDIYCPECKSKCVRFRDHWHCHHCLKRVVQVDGFWQAQFSTEFMAALRYRQEVSLCPNGEDHHWDITSLKFDLDGEGLQLPVGHAACRLCGATMGAEFIYQLDK